MQRRAAASRRARDNVNRPAHGGAARSPVAVPTGCADRQLRLAVAVAIVHHSERGAEAQAARVVRARRRCDFVELQRHEARCQAPRARHGATHFGGLGSLGRRTALSPFAAVLLLPRRCAVTARSHGWRSAPLARWRQRAARRGKLQRDNERPSGRQHAGRADGEPRHAVLDVNEGEGASKFGKWRECDGPVGGATGGRVGEGDERRLGASVGRKEEDEDGPGRLPRGAALTPRAHRELGHAVAVEVRKPRQGATEEVVALQRERAADPNDAPRRARLLEQRNEDGAARRVGVGRPRGEVGDAVAVHVAEARHRITQPIVRADGLAPAAASGAEDGGERDDACARRARGGRRGRQWGCRWR